MTQENVHPTATLQYSLRRHLDASYARLLTFPPSKLTQNIWQFQIAPKSTYVSFFPCNLKIDQDLPKEVPMSDLELEARLSLKNSTINVKFALGPAYQMQARGTQAIRIPQNAVQGFIEGLEEFRNEHYTDRNLLIEPKNDYAQRTLQSVIGRELLRFPMTKINRTEKGVLIVRP